MTNSWNTQILERLEKIGPDSDQFTENCLKKTSNMHQKIVEFSYCIAC